MYKQFAPPRGYRHESKRKRAFKLHTRHSLSHPYDAPVPPPPVIFPPPPKAPLSPSRPPAAGAASFAKKATVLPTVLSDMVASIGAAAAAAAAATPAAAAVVVATGAATPEASVAVEAVYPEPPDAAARVPPVGDDTRSVLAGSGDLLSPPFGFDDVLALDSDALVPPATAAALASPRVIALMILMCRFAPGRLSCRSDTDRDKVGATAVALFRGATVERTTACT